MVTTPKRERNRQATQARILAAAEVEFSRSGFRGTRLREVAREAGVNHALLHHYYGTKLGLFQAVLENAFSGVSVKALALLGESTDLRARMGQYVDLLVQLHVEHPNLIRLLHLAALDTSSPAASVLDGGVAVYAKPVLDGLALGLEQAQAAGEVRADIDARRLLSLAIGAVAYIFGEDQFFQVFLGGDLRAPAAIRAHRVAAMRFLESAIFL